MRSVVQWATPICLFVHDLLHLYIFEQQTVVSGQRLRIRLRVSIRDTESLVNQDGEYAIHHVSYQTMNMAAKIHVSSRSHKVPRQREPYARGARPALLP
jgi:hypothetical protein